MQSSSMQLSSLHYGLLLFAKVLLRLPLMSVSELNQFMTYVLEGWMLFSAGFVSIGFTAFVARRIQEDLAADALALAQAESASAGVTDSAIEAAKESARLEEVAAVSEQLAKTKGKQSDTSSVSVST